MKIKVLFTLGVIPFFMLLTYVPLLSECPPNWYFDSYYTNINGCVYLIEFCYKCGVTGNPSNVRITFYRKASPQMQPQPNTCNQEAPFELILESVMQRYFQKCVFPPCAPGYSTLRIIIEYPLCLKIINDAWEENGEIKHFTWSEPCMNDLLYCQIIRECCYDSRTGQYICETTQVVAQGDYNSCSDQVPTLPPPGLTWDEDWETYCYRGNQCTDIR